MTIKVRLAQQEHFWGERNLYHLSLSLYQSFQEYCRCGNRVRKINKLTTGETTCRLESVLGLSREVYADVLYSIISPFSTAALSYSVPKVPPIGAEAQ